MDKFKSKVAKGLLFLVMLTVIPTVANADKPAYCDAALEECLDNQTGYTPFWDLGTRLGCAIAYSDCGSTE